ncbi:MAG: dual specificity protein phosphatase family protein [Pseudomonadota bacterium]
MSITLEAATERIIVCGIDGIEHHVQTQNIGGIVTVTKTNPHEYLDFDISDIPHFTVSLSTTHKTDLKDKARAYLERAADMLKNIGKKKLLIHCDAGLNRSPAFTLFLLLHLSGQP